MIAKIGNRLLEQLDRGSATYEVWDSELRGFILRHRPGGTFTYFVVYRRQDGRKTRYKIGTTDVLTPAQARDRAKEVLASVLQGSDPNAEKQYLRAHSLKHYVEDTYAPWLESHRKSGAYMVKRLRRCFFPLFGEKPLSELSAWSIEKWRSERLKSGKKPSTVNRDLSILKAALSKAVEWEILTDHALRRVKPCRVDQKGIIRFLSPEEEARLYWALDQREEQIRSNRHNGNQWRLRRGYPSLPNLRVLTFVDHVKPMILLSLHTGIRRGEAFHLRWEDVDFDHKNLTIHGSTAKSGHTRHVPLNQTSMWALGAWWKQKGNPISGVIFPGENGQPLTDIKHSWATILTMASIIEFRWHDMRHHFASRLVMSGVDLNTVRELLGHTDLKMTLRYAHLAPKVKADAVAKLDASINVLSQNLKDAHG